MVYGNTQCGVILLNEVCVVVAVSQEVKLCSYLSTGLDLISTDSSKTLTQDVLMLMKHFCSRLSPNHPR